MSGDTKLSRRKVTNNGFGARPRATTISLPRITTKEESNLGGFKGINGEQLDLLNRATAVEEWLDDSPSNKHVQSCPNTAVVNKNKKPRIANKKSQRSYSVESGLNNLPSNHQQSNIFTERSNNKPKTTFTPKVVITESTFYRTPKDRTLSTSTITSVYAIPSPRSSISTNAVVEHQHPPSIVSSIESRPSLISLPIPKDRLPSLEYDSSLSEFDRKKLEDIRQLTPDEFEKLLPTLIKLGVIRFPECFFQNSIQKMTTKQLFERRRVFLLIEKYEENLDHQRYIEHLYGGILPKDNIHHQHQLLREGLSLQGQLSLLAAYKDEIERELNKKILYWRSISMQPTKTTSSEYSFSTCKSTLTTNSTQIKTKPTQTNSSFKSNTDSSLTTNYAFPQIYLPDHIDDQWQRKSIVNIIEQGMNLLDKVRSLSSANSTNNYSNQQFIQDTIYDINKQNIVKAFKRWLFLWSILYTEDKCLL